MGCPATTTTTTTTTTAASTSAGAPAAVTAAAPAETGEICINDTAESGMCMSNVKFQ